MRSTTRKKPAGIAVLVAVTALGGAGVAPAAAAVTSAENAAQSELLTAVNAARAKHGVGPLKLSRVLNRPARSHSVFLARSGELQHEGSDGKPFYVRIYKAGYPRNKAVAENLGMAGGCSTDMSKTMVRMWLDSPGHRRNLLSARYKKIGIAVVAAADCSNTVYTTDFGG